MTLANALISALTATFRADAQDLLTTVKDLVRAYDADPDDIQTCDAVYRAIDAIQREAQERIDHEEDEISLDPTYEPNPMLRDVLACIAEFYN